MTEIEGSASLIVSTSDGYIRVIPRRLIEMYNVYDYATEATTPGDVFPLPLSLADFEKWLTLCIVYHSHLELDREAMYYGQERAVLHLHDYEYIIAMMDPKDDLWSLCIIPDRALDYPRMVYQRIGEALISSVDLSNVPELLERLIPEDFDLSQRVQWEDSLVAVGIVYADWIHNGGYMREETRQIRIAHVSWFKLIQHDLGWLVNDQGHREGDGLISSQDVAHCLSPSSTHPLYGPRCVTNLAGNGSCMRLIYTDVELYPYVMNWLHHILLSSYCPESVYGEDISKEDAQLMTYPQRVWSIIPQLMGIGDNTRRMDPGTLPGLLGSVARIHVRVIDQQRVRRSWPRVYPENHILHSIVGEEGLEAYTRVMTLASRMMSETALILHQ